MPIGKISRSKLAKRAIKAGIGITPPSPPPPPIPAYFPNRRSSGLFSAPKDAASLDWAVMNGGSGPHWIRVTTFKCPVGAAKIAIAGPTAVYLNTMFTAHEAVTLSGGKPDRKSVYYEVVLEDEDLSLHPSVQVFRKYPTDVIAGTLISPGDFVPTQT